MPRPLFDTPYIFGIHEPGGETHMLEAGKPGWIIFTESIGSEPGDTGGKDFSQWSNQGLGVLCRINNGYYPGGTIPHSSRYDDFARRCANYAVASRGCKIWIIGNEMNHPVERPGVDIDWGRSVRPQDPVSTGRSVPWRFSALDEGTRSSRMAILNQGETITPQLYARCYKLCRDAIHSRPGHENDQVLIGSVAPWNNLTKYDGNPNGDWVQYFGDILKLLGPQNCDGITVHAYTHSSNPTEIYTDQFMNSPFNRYQFNFRTYRDFMNAVPASMRHLPAYITETDQDQPWKDENNSWVKRAYGEIDAWNKQPGKQQIRALILYRWPNIDRWVIEGKNGVIQDFRESLGNSYQWRDLPVPEPVPLPPPKPAFTVGQKVYAVTEVNLRQTPGAANKPPGDVRVKIVPETACAIFGGPQIVDNLVWWQVRCAAAGQQYEGWAAQAASTGSALLTSKEPTKPKPEPKPEPDPVPPVQPIKVGEKVRTLDVTNLRQTPGYQNKPDSDILYAIPAQSELVVVGGPSTADALVWWNVRFTSSEGNTFSGWVAGAKASGALLLAPFQPSQPPAPPKPPVPPAPPKPRPFAVGDKATTIEAVDLLRSPAANPNSATDLIYRIPANAELTLIEGPEQAEGRTWWRVRYASKYGNPFIGWAPVTSASGGDLLRPAGQQPAPPPPDPKPVPKPQPPPQPPTGAFKIGDSAITVEIANLRRTPGFQNKPATDILYEIPTQSAVTIINGPEAADGLVWWNVRFKSSLGNAFNGWLAQAKSSGTPLLSPAQPVGPEPNPKPQPKPAGKFSLGQHVFTTAFVNVRRSPGYVNKNATDVIEETPIGTEVIIYGGPRGADNLVWWQSRYTSKDSKSIAGWIAETDAKGQALLSETKPPAPQPVAPMTAKTFQVGHEVVNAFTDKVNVRRSAGFQGKAADDLLAQMPPGAAMTITGGPQNTDGLTWWEIRSTATGQSVAGWVAEIGTKGERLLILSSWKDKIRLGKPFEGTWKVTQLFADRPQVYKVFSYDGVALRGHNGVDFGLATGTHLLATDDGEVLRADFDAKGYGYFVLLKHAWGESVYGHMKSVGVKVGDKVKRGAVLGPSNNTGNSSGPHLHFGIRIYPCKRSDGWGGYCDPVPFMNPDDLIIPDNIRSIRAAAALPGMAPDEIGRERV